MRLGFFEEKNTSYDGFAEEAALTKRRKCNLSCPRVARTHHKKKFYLYLMYYLGCFLLYFVKCIHNLIENESALNCFDFVVFV